MTRTKIKETETNQDLRRAIKWMAAIGVIPGILLPLYNHFLHGPGHAASILTRGSAYAEAHMIGALLSLLLMFGLLAVYLAFVNRLGKFGLVAFMVVLFAQGMWAITLTVDWIINPLLSHFDPTLQTSLHSANIEHVAASGYLGGMFGMTLELVYRLTFLHFLGYFLFGIALLRAKVVTWPIGILMVIGSIPFAFALHVPHWVQTLAYAATGGAVAWACCRLWKGYSSRQ